METIKKELAKRFLGLSWGLDMVLTFPRTTSAWTLTPRMSGPSAGSASICCPAFLHSEFCSNKLQDSIYNVRKPLLRQKSKGRFTSVSNLGVESHVSQNINLILRPYR